MNLVNLNTNAVLLYQGPSVVASLPGGFSASVDLEGTFQAILGGSLNISTNNFGSTNGTCYVTWAAASPTAIIGFSTVGTNIGGEFGASGGFAAPVGSFFLYHDPSNIDYALGWTVFGTVPNNASAQMVMSGTAPVNRYWVYGPTNGTTTYTTNIVGGSDLGSFTAQVTTKSVEFFADHVQVKNHEIEAACLLGGVIVGMSVNVFRFVLSLLGSMATGGE